MIDIYEWLKDVNQSSYAIISSLFMTSLVSSLQSMDGILVADDLMDQIMFLDLDEDGNVYFDMRHAWDAHFEQPQINVKLILIDSSVIMTNSLEIIWHCRDFESK